MNEIIKGKIVGISDPKKLSEGTKKGKKWELWSIGLNIDGKLHYITEFNKQLVLETVSPLKEQMIVEFTKIKQGKYEKIDVKAGVKILGAPALPTINKQIDVEEFRKNLSDLMNECLEDAKKLSEKHGLDNKGIETIACLFFIEQKKKVQL